MIKKLIKYGNSTALVLDKAILELLNIEQGSLIKLKIEGSSLIISSVETNFEKAVSKKHFRAGVYDSEIEPNHKAFSVSRLQELKEKYAQEIEKLTADPSFFKELDNLKDDLEMTGDREEYLAEYGKLRKKHFPQLALLDEEIQSLESEAVLQKKNPEELWY